ncbi:hypothetical protein NC652_000540 [Populus alba x Populus x berolinensis]|uniref:Uncharacterized protein n=1 Tax=Populus alba TaxID=43335 RepID=A0ACC4CVP5_POPAL|nr:hypothetical protein NC652_000540 [Populus alba x Populus x berolinensis]
MEGTWITVTAESNSCLKHCMEARGVYGLGLWILVVEMPKSGRDSGVQMLCLLLMGFWVDPPRENIDA